jgi:hypothetical protein
MKQLSGLALLVSLLLLTPAVGSAEDAPGGKPKKHKPPAAAFEACKDKVVNDACSYEGRKKTVNGTCQPRKKGDGLVCRRAPKQKP